MTGASYAERRETLTTYFDRTALDAWAKLTSDAKVSRVRATVRAGRDRMRATLLAMLPGNLTGATVLDAGCGTGPLAVEAARRGARVVAVDVSAQTIGIARDRCPREVADRIDFRVGDMAAPEHGHFDHVVAMDSLIHYAPADLAAALASLAARTGRSIAFTFAPRTPAITMLFTLGALFPRRDRAPAIVPTGPAALARRLATHPGLAGFQVGRTERVSGGFYKSQALELVAK